MTKRSIVKMALAACLLVLVSSVGAFTQKTDCTKTTDADIVEAVYTKMKVKYDSQVMHINVRSKDGVVTIEGWATTKKVSREIAKLAKKTSCVKSVVNTMTIGAGGGCPSGYVQCGTICIPSTEVCNICKTKTCN